MSPRDYRRPSAFYILALSLMLLSGSSCSSVRLSGALPFLSETQEQDVEPAEFCTVELRSVGRKPKTVKLALTEDMRVSDVLTVSKASKKYPRADVHVWRKPPRKAHEMVKLEVRFDHQSGQVTYDTDYAIHPNDRVVVVEQPFSIFDEAYNSLLGPILGNIGQH